MMNKNMFFLGLLLLVPNIVNASYKDMHEPSSTDVAQEFHSTFSLKSHAIMPAIWGATMFSAHNALDGNKKWWLGVLAFSALNSSFELSSWKQKPTIPQLKTLVKNTIVNAVLTTVGVCGFKELRQNSYNLLTADVSKMDIPKLTAACVSLLAIKPCYNQFLNPLVNTMWNTPVNNLKFSITNQQINKK